MNYAYLHGFAEDDRAPKGERLAEVFRQHGIPLLTPDLNQPSFSELTFSGMIEVLDAMDEASNGEPWCLIGASMGGYIAARWAELNPGRVARSVLMAPAFDMQQVWQQMLGQERLERWREEEEFWFFGPDGHMTGVHWELFRDARDNHPRYPEADCPTWIFHGSDDDLIPLEHSEEFVEQTSETRLTVVDDSHKLQESIWRVARTSLDFLVGPGRVRRSRRYAV